jgi:hypothetical protein
VKKPVMRSPLSIWSSSSLAMIAAASLLALMSSCTDGLAQAGSTGGAIGKQDKSISGDQEAPSASPSARKKPPARAAKTNEGTGSACGQMATNIAGTWNSSSPSSVSEDIRPTGCDFTATLSNSFFRHAIRGRHSGGSNFSLIIARTNQVTGCTTVMSGSMTVVSEARMQWVITGTDGKCDLSANYSETRTWTR